MGNIIALLLVYSFGKQVGPCEVCGAEGWKQTSVVDPLSPALKYLCADHHIEVQRRVYD